MVEVRVETGITMEPKREDADRIGDKCGRTRDLFNDYYYYYIK